MAANCSPGDLQAHDGASPCGGRCDKLLVGLVLLTAIRSSESMAGEQGVTLGDSRFADFDTADSRSALAAPSLSTLRISSSPLFSVPETFHSAMLPDVSPYPASDFRPRGRSMLEKETAPKSTRDDAPMLGATTVWQRLSEYRGHNRVRVLTLWEAGGSSVSLQAGRRGDPSLQWTSRLMNRGGATRGLLDHMFSASIAGAGRSLHWSPHTVAGEPPGKSAKLPDAGSK